VNSSWALRCAQGKLLNRTIPNEIRNRHGERLDFTYHPGAAELSTLVVIGHGVTGNKDRPLLVELASLLARTAKTFFC
jgi:hypothetical protein